MRAFHPRSLKDTIKLSVSASVSQDAAPARSAPGLGRPPLADAAETTLLSMLLRRSMRLPWTGERRGGWGSAGVPDTCLSKGQAAFCDAGVWAGDRYDGAGDKGQAACLGATLRSNTIETSASLQRDPQLRSFGR